MRSTGLPRRRQTSMKRSKSLELDRETGVLEVAAENTCCILWVQCRDEVAADTPDGIQVSRRDVTTGPDEAKRALSSNEDISETK